MANSEISSRDWDKKVTQLIIFPITINKINLQGFSLSLQILNYTKSSQLYLKNYQYSN